MSAKNKERLGVYFGLAEQAYHDDDALGSTNVRDLVKGPDEYWYWSALNPRRPKHRDTEATIYGDAVHKLVLEGRQAYGGLYSRRPDDIEGADRNDKTKVTKMHNAECNAAGLTPLHGDDWDRALICDAMINKNPELAGVLEGGFAEVSIFWIETVVVAHARRLVRCKARVDYMRPKGAQGGFEFHIPRAVDLKNVTNIFRTSFREACWWARKKRRMDIQAKLYLRGLAQMQGFVADGLVYGDGDRELLARIASGREFLWQWIFYQASGAPSVYSQHISPGNPMLARAEVEIDQALARYGECRERFGDDMWVVAEPVAEADEDDGRYAG
jgi:hypothetical protein